MTIASTTMGAGSTPAIASPVKNMLNSHGASPPAWAITSRAAPCAMNMVARRHNDCRQADKGNQEAVDRADRRTHRERERERGPDEFGTESAATSEENSEPPPRN